MKTTVCEAEKTNQGSYLILKKMHLWTGKL